jgi:hypothetical protein
VVTQGGMGLDPEVSNQITLILLGFKVANLAVFFD